MKRVVVSLVLGLVSPAVAEEMAGAASVAPAAITDLRPYGVPEGETWPWHFPPIDPTEPPLPEGMPSLWLTYHLASLIATDDDAWDGQKWKPQAWCMRWDDGCTVCERSKVGGAAVCRNNRQNPHPEQGCKPALRHPYCTSMNLRAFERACRGRYMATYGQTDRAMPRPIPWIAQFGIRSFALSTYRENFGYKEHCLEKALNDDVQIIKFYAGQDLRKLSDEALRRFLSGGYISTVVVKYAAQRYLINRLEAKRYFICRK
ncbi:MAG: hypothetical protein GX458_01865 [Phyllobacteriaceae bacterium]|nr:hypothetical protein [Phyllobacteriaceae bacterium]